MAFHLSLTTGVPFIFGYALWVAFEKGQNPFSRFQNVCYPFIVPGYSLLSFPIAARRRSEVGHYCTVMQERTCSERAKGQFRVPADRNGALFQAPYQASLVKQPTIWDISMTLFA